jgi:single-strand DNA-binding protein
MSEGLNRVMLLGNLAADPELRHTQGGQAVLNLRLATNEVYFDKDRQKKERTDYHNVVVWGRRGEALAKHLSKGSSIFVEGALRTSSYEGRDGQKRWKTEVIARNVLFTGGGGRRAGGPAAEYDQGGGGHDASPPPGPAYDQAGPPADAFGGEDDDIPF